MWREAPGRLPRRLRRIGARLRPSPHALALAGFKKNFSATGNARLLLVGHDAHRHGAQLLLLHLAKTYVNSGIDVRIVLLDGGDLLGAYQAVCPTLVAADIPQRELMPVLKQCHFSGAICNTIVTGDWVASLAESGLPVVSLVHELPRLIAEYDLVPQAQKIADAASHIVFAADIVRRGFTSLVVTPEEHCVVRPQGSYFDFSTSDDSSLDIRRRLGIPQDHQVVLNVGFGDLRKGYDIFISTALGWCKRRSDVHFVWLGGIHTDLAHWLHADIQQHGLESCIHLCDFTDDVAAFYSAADALLLTSREDPYPTVVLEAMGFGLPVVAFDGCTGFDTVLGRFGFLASREEGAIDDALQAALVADEQASKARIAWFESQCQFADYAEDLLDLIWVSNSLKPARAGA